MVLCVRPGTDNKKKQAIIDSWYREQLKKSCAAVNCQVGTTAGRESGAVFCAADENKMGELQLQSTQHQAQYRTC